MHAGSWGGLVDERGRPMGTLDLARLAAFSRPVVEGFERVDPKPWDRRALLLELAGEIGSLAHHAQHWDGFKAGVPKRSEVADELADVLFLVLRLAWVEKIELPPEIRVPELKTGRAADLVLEICGTVPRLIEPGPAMAQALISLVQSLGALSELLGLDLAKAHEVEMRIAGQYFRACGGDWPRIRPVRHPRETARLFLALWERRKWNRV